MQQHRQSSVEAVMRGDTNRSEKPKAEEDVQERFILTKQDLLELVNTIKE